MNSSTAPHTALKPTDSAIVLVDHQPGVLAMASSVPADQLTRNVGVLARLGEEMGIPLVVTSTREELEFLGTNLKSIQTSAPRAYAARVQRAGTLNAFDDTAFVKALQHTQRKNLVIAGLTTDVCLFHSVVSALEAGYKVRVVADASGTTSTLADAVTYDRLRDLGAVITTTIGILFELYSDLSTSDGQRAEKIAGAAFTAAKG